MTDGNQDPAVGAADREAYKREQQAEQGRKVAKGCGFAVLGLFLLLVLIGLVSMCSGEPRADGNAAKGGSMKPADLNASVNEQWSTILATIGSCDTLGKDVQSALESNDVVEAYSAAKAADQGCTRSSIVLGMLKPPAGVPTDKQQAFRDAIELCASANGYRGMAFESMAKGLDTELKPSLVADYKEKIQGATTKGVGCAFGYTAAAEAVGVSLADTKPQP